MSRLSIVDQLALGFMTFALFLGAGNIIFPPSAGLAAGENLWPAALGFLLTAVGLPLATVVALARLGGGLDRLTAPLGAVPGLLLAVVVYLAIGPLFATPRTAVVSFELGIAPFVAGGGWALAGYSAAYFALVLYLSLSPGRLVDRVGKLITPALLVALAILGVSAVLQPVGPAAPATPSYRDAPLAEGFLQGYLTMDTLGALVFGIVIATAVRDRGITAAGLVTRYTTIAGLIAAAGLSLVYLALFHLGAGSQAIAAGAENGGQILAAFVQHRFGSGGSLLLAVVITLACLTTAVGLTTACGEFFSKRLPVSYRAVVLAVVLFSFVVANQGLSRLISVSVPVLVALYPLAIVLVLLSLADRCWLDGRRVFRPVMAVTLLFGIADGLRAAGFQIPLLAELDRLPLAASNLGWAVPALIALVLAVLFDRVRGARGGQG